MQIKHEKIAVFTYYFIITSVHIRVEEKLSVTAGKDGGLQNMEIHGLAFIKVSDEKNGKIQLQLKNNDHKGVQIQVSDVINCESGVSNCSIIMWV